MRATSIFLYSHEANFRELHGPIKPQFRNSTKTHYPDSLPTDLCSYSFMFRS